MEPESERRRAHWAFTLGPCDNKVLAPLLSSGPKALHFNCRQPCAEPSFPGPSLARECIVRAPLAGSDEQDTLIYAHDEDTED